MATKFTYTETETQEIVAKYQAGVELEVLATDYGKSVASVRMKLVKLGVYQKATSKASSKLDGWREVISNPPAKSGGFPKTKSGILAYYKSCVAKVGYSDF
jgi:hypothetical protein